MRLRHFTPESLDAASAQDYPWRRPPPPVLVEDTTLVQVEIVKTTTVYPDPFCSPFSQRRSGITLTETVVSFTAHRLTGVHDDCQVDRLYTFTDGALEPLDLEKDTPVKLTSLTPPLYESQRPTEPEYFTMGYSGHLDDGSRGYRPYDYDDYDD